MEADLSIAVKSGEIVQLKSGGPDMTVDSVMDEWGILTVYCSWFEKNKLNKGSFPITSVRKLEE